MATIVTKLRIIVDLDSSEEPSAVPKVRYRLEDSAAPGVRTGGGVYEAMTVGDLNAIAHDAGDAGEVITDLVAAVRAHAGL